MKQKETNCVRCSLLLETNDENHNKNNPDNLYQFADIPIPVTRA